MQTIFNKCQKNFVNVPQSTKSVCEEPSSFTEALRHQATMPELWASHQWQEPISYSNHQTTLPASGSPLSSLQKINTETNLKVKFLVGERNSAKPGMQIRNLKVYLHNLTQYI